MSERDDAMLCSHRILSAPPPAPLVTLNTQYKFSQDTVDHTPAGTGNYFSHGSLSKIFFVEFKSESLKNKKVSKFQQL